MPTDADEPDLIALANRHYAAGDFTRKADSYWTEYERLVAPNRHRPIRILELGVYSGASLLVWHDYLPKALIVGVDIAAMPDAIAGRERIHYVRASQDDQAALDEAVAIAGGAFDLIIDDAAHIGYLAKRSFIYLFPRWLRQGGVYAIEDFGTGYLTDYPDGGRLTVPPDLDAVPQTQIFRSHQFGMVGVVKQLIDHMMQALVTDTKSRFPIASIGIWPNVAFIHRGDDVPGGVPASDVAVETITLPMPNEFLDAIASVNTLASRVTALESAVGAILIPIGWLRRLRRASRRSLAKVAAVAAGADRRER